MKKLLSLALVLTMLFTIISVPSVSAATETTILAKADIESNTGTWSAYAVSGPDAGAGGTTGGQKTRIASHTATSATLNGNTYTVSSSMTNVNVATAAQTHPAVATGMNSNANILKLTQTGNTSILRLYTADGALDIQAGDTVTVHFKMLLTDFYDHPQYTDGTTGEVVKPSAITAPATYSWRPGYMNTLAGGRKIKVTNIATEQWTDVDLTYSVTESTLDTYKSMYGLCVEGLAVKASGSDFYKTSFPGTVYIAEAWISRTREVSSNKVTVTKLGEGTVTGDGEIVSGSAATLTATPAEGYHFAGWYEKTASNADANCYSKDATYTFTPSSDVNIVAVFEKDAVDGWIELTGSEFDGSAPPNTNLWGKTDAWVNVNNLQSVTTYEAENIEAPDASCGTGVLKIDRSQGATSVTGMVDGRIGYYPGYEVRFEQGQKYRLSYWIYVVSTDKGAEAGETISFPWGPMKKTNTVIENDTLEVGKWVKKSREFEVDSTWEDVYTALRLSPANISTTDTTKYDEGAYDSLNLAYVDSVKFERYEDNSTTEATTVTTTAENGVVYGAGEYEIGDQATLIAAGNTGYVFEGYYVGDECVSTNPKYTFTVEGDITVEAKFVERAEATFPENNLYHWGAEDGELGSYNSWYKWVGQENASDNKADGAGVITWAQAAELGVTVPSNDPTFGDNLYADNFANSAKTIAATVDGRMRGWENGKIVNNSAVTEKTEASGRYIEGKQYKFTWWVYPKSMRVVDDTDTYAQNNQTRLKITHNDGKSTEISTTETLNIGEWNKIEWVFTANAKSALYAPGIYYQWVSSGTADSEGKKNIVNCAFYDNIQVEEITSWQYGDTTAPANWYNYLDQADAGIGASSNNIAACSVVSYADAGIAKASENAGDKVVKMDYSKPAYTEAKYNAAKEAGTLVGDYANMSYEEAYAHLTRPANWGGDLSLRFRDIVAANVLTLGKTYKISIKVYIAKKTDIETGNDTTSNTAVRIIGTRSGQSAEGDGKNVAKSVPFGQWTEVSYTFKATEAGVDFAPSLKVELKQTPPTEIPSIVYIDDVRVDQVHVDDLDLVIEDGETEVTATATVYDIKSGDTVNAIVIIAGYDVDGKLVSVSFSNGGASKALAVGDTLDAAYTKADGIDSYVAFLWNDLTNIRPYTMPKTLGLGE